MPRLKRPSPSMAVAVAALCVALGGTATAAGVLITTSTQIKDGAIKRQDLAQDTIDTSRVKDKSLRIDDLNSAAQRSIAGGPAAYEAFRIEGPKDVGAGDSKLVATLSDIPPGAYAIFAKTILTATDNEGSLLEPGGSVSGHCTLDAGDTDEARTLLGAPYSNSPSNLDMQLVRTFGSPGSAKVTCEVSKVKWQATNTSIIAIRVDPVTRKPVAG